MKRLALLVCGLALVGGVAAGCSKTDVPTTAASANADANKVANDAQKCADLATKWSSMFTPLASPTFSDSDKQAVVKAADDFKAQVPDNIKAEVDVITKGITNAKTQTDVAQFLGTKDYTDNFTKVTTYVTTDCNKVGK